MTPRSKIIEKSLSCFRFGMTSVIPLIGLVTAVIALARFHFVIVNTNERWNCARLRLYVGALLAMGSLLGHALAAVFIYLKVLRDIANA
jgi:hypothetical protein